MKTRLLTIWDFLRSTYWFIPGAISLFAIVLAIVLPIVDATYNEAIVDKFPWIAVSDSAAQEILNSIAGAMVTIAGVVFSITIVTLSIASSQLGPRLLRTYMNSGTMHVALGVFVGTGLYCLLVLSAIRGEDNTNGYQFVPHFSLLVGVLFAVIGLGTLIVFIHRVAVLIQAPNVIQSVGHDLDKAVDRLYPEELGRSPKDPVTKKEVKEKISELGSRSSRVPALFEGYIQSLDLDALMEFACERNVVLYLKHRPGVFVTRESVLAEYWPAGESTDETFKRINEAFTVGNRPTPLQDVESAANELVEVAVRSLSTGINDPFTAINCIDRLGASLCRLAQREIPSPYRHDQEGNLRVIAYGPTFAHVLESSFRMIWEYGQTAPSIMIRMLEALATIADHARRESDREAIMKQATTIRDLANKNFKVQSNLKDIHDQFDLVVEAVEQRREPPSKPSAKLAGKPAES